MKQKVLVFIFCIILFVFACFALNVKKADKTVIKFSSWGSQSETEIMKAVISDYEKKHNNIKIEFIHIPQNYFQKIHLLFASGLEPDILFFNNQNIQLYINAGLLTDLSPFFENTETIFFKEALDCFKNGNGLFAIPRDISNLVLYYNKDIFKELGVKIPSKITSIDELKKLTIKLTNKNHWGINFEQEPLYWVYYLASAGGGVISDDKKSIIINADKSLYALNLYANLVNKYHSAPSSAQIGSMTTAQMFINGKLAMYLGGRWMVPKFRETINFDWDIIEFPATEENRVYIDSSGWAIAEKSKNKAEAIEFLKYLSSKSIIDKFTACGLIIPARTDSAQSDIFLEKNKKPANNIAFIEMIKNSKPTPVVKEYNSVIDIIKEKSQCIFEGTCKAEDAFDIQTVDELKGLL